jgi:hypothetical protein
VACGRISPTDAVRRLQSAAAPAGEEMIVLVIVASRPDRLEPRVLKRRAKQYDLMNKPRCRFTARWPC